MKSLIILAAAVSVLASPAAAATKARDEAPSAKLPTKLPKMAKKKKAKINFEVNSGTHITTVIVRTPLPLEKALEDQKQAAHEVMDVSSSAPSSQGPETVAPTIPQLDSQVRSSRYHVLPLESESSKARRALIDEPLLPATASESPSRTEAMPTIAEAPEASSAPGPELMGPPLPPTPPVAIETSTQVRVDTTEVPPAIVSSTAVTASPELALSAAFTPRVAERVHRLYWRSSFMNARYSEIDSQLENGARGVAIGWARELGDFEARASLEFGFGKGQDMALQNTRYLIGRGDALYFFRPNTVRPFVGFGLGVGHFDVRLERPAANPHEVLYREYAKGSAAILSPSAGIRLDLASLALDLSAEYLAVIGAGSTSALGGWTGALTLSFPF